jgi:ubiquitin-like modifier-activating enzyme 5
MAHSSVCLAGIIAGLLVQNSLKYLLSFGVVAQYLGYSSLKDFFPQMAIRPNPGCLNELCGSAQAEHQVSLPGTFKSEGAVHKQRQAMVQGGGPVKSEHMAQLSAWWQTNMQQGRMQSI